MWTQTIVQLVALSLAGGIVCGILWDFHKVPRIFLGISETPKWNKPCFFIVFAQDVLFCLACGCVALAVLYYGNEGNLRGIALLGMIAGFAAYRVSIGTLVCVFTKKLREFAARVRNKIILLIKSKDGCENTEKKLKRIKIGKHQNCKVIGDK